MRAAVKKNYCPSVMLGGSSKLVFIIWYNKTYKYNLVQEIQISVRNNYVKRIRILFISESGYTGEYESKEAHYKVKHGTIAEMIHDSGMLWNDYDKTIPCYEELNKILKSGEYGRLVEWIQ